MQRTRARGGPGGRSPTRARPSRPERRFTRGLHALGHEQSDRLGSEPTRHELEHELRRWIQPLHVVHRHQDGPLLGQAAKDGQTRRRDRALIRRWPLVLREQERRLERAPLHRREHRENVVQHRLEQIGQPANDSRASLSAGRHVSARRPRLRACSTPARHTVVFPIPASPWIRSAPGSSPSSRATTAASSSSLPTTPGKETGKPI